ncbi:MAG: 6-bladed beta-propeller [Dysgonamonadaceae bacterium]|jgi:hypothetical protein|nr:6-bladed beta-propeller [Dysgonamonadaceae bacterium]
MKKESFFIIALLWIGCENNQQRNARYAKEQIQSLYLDSTLVLKVNTDSITIIDLNSFLGEKSFDFGDFVEDVKLLPLESTDESLMADIYKILVTDSFVYVMDELLLKCTIISDIEKNKLKGIKDDDNPILVFFRLKDF